MSADDRVPASTQGGEYTRRLIRIQSAWYKRLIDVQLPYRWNLLRLRPGLTLDLGCGIGRNLINLRGRGIGIDHNPESVQFARQRGLTAFTPEEFRLSKFSQPETFDSILLAHVAEHMTEKEVVELLAKHLHFLKPEGRLIVITPQEAGQRSDPTHVEFMDLERLRRIVTELGLTVLREYSFPLPRLFGRWFIYNEFVSVSRKELRGQATQSPNSR